MEYKIGFVGVGVMAGAILDRIIDNLDVLELPAGQIIIYDLIEDKLKSYHQKGVVVASSSKEVFESADIVFLGVKPQMYLDILTSTNSNYVCSTLVSIMAGVEISTLREVLGEKMGIVRVMPNLPCQVGKGMTALHFDKVNNENKDFVAHIFQTTGKVLEISEDKFHAVTSISGSGSAYIFMIADSLIKAGIDGGLTPEESRTLALQTIEGAGAFAAISTYDMDTLVEKVCSKGGTTIEAINSFKQDNLEEIIKKGVEACRQKSISLSRKI